MSGCCLCGESSAERKYNVAKWFYLVGFTITAVLTWLLRDFAGDWLAENADAFKLCQGSSEQEACGSQEVALRISFGNFCFFALHGLLLLCIKHEEDPRICLHGSLWFWQSLLWAGTIIGFFFVPSTALIGYAQVARIGSGLFLVLQLILLIDFIYKVNEWLVAKDTRWAWALLVSLTVVCLGLGLTLIAFSYIRFAPSGSCSLNLFFTTWSLVVLLLLMGVLAIRTRAPTAGLLTSGAVFLYCSALLYSALNSEPLDYDCRADSGSGGKAIQIIGFIVVLATVIYSTYSAGVASDDMFGGPASAAAAALQPDKDTLSGLPYRADFMHLIFALASMYLAMLFTSWQVSPSTTTFQIDQGWISTWVKMASKWLCELLYLWTVVAPAIFPDRDFGFKS